MKVYWASDSEKKLASFAVNAKLNLGRDLARVQEGLKPYDSSSMGSVLRGVFELRDEDKDFWYRLFYTQIGDSIYVLDCIKKKTNQTARADIERCRDRLTAIRLSLASQAGFKGEKHAKEGKK